MIKRRGLTLLTLSLGLGLVAVWLAHNWVKGQLTAPKPVPQKSVIVASVDIPFGVKVQSHFLRVIKLPENTPIGRHFSDPKQVIGRIALQKVLRGEILLRGQFVKDPAGSILAALLTPGMRAITVPVNDVVGVAGFLLPGNHVDVVEARLIGTSRRAVTRTVLQNLRVLAVDQTDSRKKNGPIVVHAVTLEVTPPQADILVKAMTEGHIQLTLRGPTDLTLDTPPPRPLRAPSKRSRRRIRVIVRRVIVHRQPRQDVTIIRGTHVDQVHTSRDHASR